METTQMKQKGLKLLGVVLVLALITLALEVFIFNFRHFESMGNEATEPTEVVFLDGVRDNGDGTITILEKGEAGIEYLGLDAHISNAHIDISTLDGTFARMEIFYMITDAGNSLYFPLPKRTVVTSEALTSYTALKLSGVSPKIKLRMDSLAGQTLRFGGVTFNRVCPLRLSPLRMLFVFITFTFLWTIRAKGALFSQTIDLKKWPQLLVVVLCVIMLSTLMISIMLSNPLFADPPWSHHRQYSLLAKSFAQGKTNIDITVDEKMLELSNPYDPYLRFTSGAEFEWDAAFYEGKYYVYFGVVPCLLFHLPFYLLTGYELNNMWVLCLIMPVFLAGIYLMFSRLLRYFFDKTRFSVYLLLATAAAFGTGAMFVARHPDFYVVPMFLGLLFAVWGLYFWLVSLDKEGGLRRIPLVLGSLCMALVAGCRPQLLLMSGLALFLFIPQIKHRRVRRGDVVAFFMPYVIVAAGIMAYNAVRFSSPFDFGANYNLTTSDMTNLGFVFERGWLSLYTQLFQPPNISNFFPYIRNTNVSTAFQGTIIVDYMLGGLFATQPLLLTSLLSPLMREWLREKKVFGICLYTLACGLFLPLFDAVGAGVLYRYILDFAIFLYIPAALVVAALMDRLKGIAAQRVHVIVTMLALASIGFNLLLICSCEAQTLYRYAPELYEHIHMLCEFYH